MDSVLDSDLIKMRSNPNHFKTSSETRKHINLTGYKWASTDCLTATSYPHDADTGGDRLAESSNRK